MPLMMQVLEDIQVEGRCFLRARRVQAIRAGDSCLELAAPDAHTTLCAVPTKKLAHLTLFQVMLVNQQVGLIDEPQRCRPDADDVRSSISQCAPDYETLELDKASS